MLRKSSNNWLFKYCPPYFQTSGGIPSGPAAFPHFNLLIAMSSSTILGVSVKWCLIGSCGIMLFKFAKTLIFGFSRRLKCSLHLSMIAFLSLWSMLLSIPFTGSRYVPSGPYTSLSDAKKALESFWSDRSWIFAAFLVHQSFFICCSFFWSSDFTLLYLRVVYPVHLLLSVVWRSVFFSLIRSVLSSFDSVNQAACFLDGFLSTTVVAPWTAFFKIFHRFLVLPSCTVGKVSFIAAVRESLSCWLFNFSTFSFLGGCGPVFLKGRGFGLMLQTARIIKWSVEHSAPFIALVMRSP